MYVVDPDELLPDPQGPIAINLANEGVPFRAIVRSLEKGNEYVRATLHDAINRGCLIEMPRDDWPPGSKRDQRLPCSGYSQHNDDQLILDCRRVFRMTNLQSMFFITFLRRPECTKEVLHAVIEKNRRRGGTIPDGETDQKMVDVLVHHVRSKLKPFAITIKTIWGTGYMLEPNDRAKVLKELDNYRAKQAAAAA